jgi:aryl-alcohol dehydrogenase-like predicted oxidoreductase
VGLQVPYNLLNRDIERELLPMAEAYGMTVAAWGPLAGGVLSGKYTRPAAQPATGRASARPLTERERAVATVVQDVADELGVTASQVAIAWTMRRSPAVHPIIGARTVEQVTDNLGAADCALPDEATGRLAAATGFTPGFPTDFISEVSPWVFGAAGLDVAGRNQADRRS